MASTIALTLYDYLLVFGDEVRGRVHAHPPPSSHKSFPKVRYVWKGRKTWGAFSFVVCVNRTRSADTNHTTASYLYILVRPSGPPSLGTPDGIPLRPIESGSSHGVSVLDDSEHQQPKEFQGLFRKKARLASINVLTDSPRRSRERFDQRLPGYEVKVPY